MEALYHYKANLERIVDGDTVDLIIELGFDTMVFRRVRLAGINCPETRGATKALGLAAKTHLAELLAGAGRLHVVSTKVEKFGRVLGVLIKRLDDGTEINLNDLMIADGHAIPYDGGARSDADFLPPTPKPADDAESPGSGSGVRPLPSSKS